MTRRLLQGVRFVDTVHMFDRPRPPAVRLLSNGPNQGRRRRAFVGGPDGPGPVTVWRAAGRDDWRKGGELPGSNRAAISGAAVGAGGWVAFGVSTSRRQVHHHAWYSADGVSWRMADVAPTASTAEVKAVFADRTGFIAVSTNDPVGGCAVDPTNWRNLTWTSIDGRAWRLVHEMGGGAHVESLRRRGRTLIGIGMIGEYEGALWTAQLPDARGAEGPLPTPVPLIPGGGCGA